MNRLILLFLLIIFPFVCGPASTLFAGDAMNNECMIAFHNAIMDENANSNLEYDYVKNLYPNQNLNSWQASGRVKRKPDLIFDPSDIASIEIIKPSIVIGRTPSVTIVFKFKPSSSKILNQYTQKNIDTYQAIIINNSLFAIAKVLDAIESEMHLTTAKTIDAVKADLACVSKNIVIKEEMTNK